MVVHHRMTPLVTALGLRAGSSAPGILVVQGPVGISRTYSRPALTPGGDGRISAVYPRYGGVGASYASNLLPARDHPAEIIMCVGT